METNHESSWVDGKLATLHPQWTPNVVHARSLLDSKLGAGERTRALRWIPVAAMAAAVVAALLFPEPRAFAQELWDRLFLNRVDVVRVDLSHSPVSARVTTDGAQQQVRDAGEAERIAGFLPFLPERGAGKNPVLTVTSRIDAEQTIHVRDIEAALKRLGASDVPVPSEWEGKQLRARIGPMVTADYADDLQVLQAPPVEVSLPSGFALERFIKVVFRSVGVADREARAMAAKFSANPAWLLDIAADEPVSVQEIRVHSGPALLLEDFDDRGAVERATVLRSTRDRIYSVSSSTRALSLQVADLLP